MKTAKEIYKRDLDDDYFCAYLYQPMLEEFGKIIIQVDDSGYQGNSRVIYKNGDKFGYLQFGWGSCSGCDVLQNCRSINEVQELMDRLNNSIKWFDNEKEILKYFKEKDWELEYSWHAEEQRLFIEKTIEYFEKQI